MPPLFSTAVAAAVLHGFPLINLQCYFSHPLNVNDSCIPVYLTTLRTWLFTKHNLSYENECCIYWVSFTLLGASVQYTHTLKSRLSHSFYTTLQLY